MGCPLNFTHWSWQTQCAMVSRRNREGPLLARTDSTNGQQKEPTIKYLARKQLDSNCLQILFKCIVPHFNDKRCLEICKSNGSIWITVSFSWLQTMTQNYVIAFNVQETHWEFFRQLWTLLSFKTLKLKPFMESLNIALWTVHYSWTGGHYGKRLPAPWTLCGRSAGLREPLKIHMHGQHRQ